LDDRAALALGQVWKPSPNSWTEFLMFKIGFERPDFIKEMHFFSNAFQEKFQVFFLITFLPFII